jgi:hypothetical protein
MKEETFKGYIQALGKKESLKIIYDAQENEIDLNGLPKSMNEAESYARFWDSLLKDFSKDVNEVTFFYQEESEVIPLSKFKRFVNFLGAKYVASKIPGEVKQRKVKPLLISSEKGLARVINNREDWEELNLLSKKTKDFSSPYVFTLAPLCYRTLIPLELITKMKLGAKN